MPSPALIHYLTGTAPNMDMPRFFLCTTVRIVAPRAATLLLPLALIACQPTAKNVADNTDKLTNPITESAQILVLNPDGSVSEQPPTAPQSLTISGASAPRDTPVETVASDGTVTIVLGNSYQRPLRATLGCDDQLQLSHQPNTTSSTPDECTPPSPEEK